jgi:LPS-assembly lipoprotein
MAWRSATGKRRLLLLAGPGAALTGLAGALSGCGFQLRREPTLPFKRIALTGFGPRSTQAAALRRAAGAGVDFVSTPAQAEVVVAGMSETSERAVVGSSAAGQVRELRLRVKLRYRVLGRDGQEWLGPTELSQYRDMTYNETDALAKELEEGQLVRDMEADIARQVVRRLSTLSRP